MDCLEDTEGCTDENADNYDSVDIDNGSCEYLGCTDAAYD